MTTKEDRVTIDQLGLLTNDQLEAMTDSLCRRFNEYKVGRSIRWVSVSHKNRVFRSSQMYAVTVQHGVKATLITIPGNRDNRGIDFTQAEISYVREQLQRLCPGTDLLLSTNGLDAAETTRFRAAVLGLVIYRIVTGIAHDSGTATTANQQSN
mgnify:CR=1 FL=1